ncbi:MAG: hypothetical protein O3A63_09105 [Proteobacteria bacterium]|nr:hypothetical protein [Pseudomonadota bacterium]
MPHIIEPAASGRSKCRACARAIAKAELRFGECLPNPFADGDMTVWFHLLCAAYTRPDSLLEILTDADVPAAQINRLVEVAAFSREYERVVRIGGIQLAPSARARCRHCREPIEKDHWRIPVKFFEEGMFNSSGFIHLTCSKEYFGTDAIAEQIFHFAEDLDSDAQTRISTLLSNA